MQAKIAQLAFLSVRLLVKKIIEAAPQRPTEKFEDDNARHKANHNATLKRCRGRRLHWQWLGSVKGCPVAKLCRRHPVGRYCGVVIRVTHD